MIKLRRHERLLRGKAGWAALALLSATALSPAAQAASAGTRPQHYRVVVLPPEGGADSYLAGYLFYAPLTNVGTLGVAIDNAAKSFYNSYTYTHGVVINDQGLPANPQGAPAGSYINWVNQWGLSAGYATRTNSVSATSTDNAVVWLPGGEIFEVAPEPGTQSHAVWVNDLAQVSGWIENGTADACSFGTGEQTQGFIWQYGVVQMLGTLGGAQSYGEFINDLGQVSGHAQTSSTPNSVTGCPPYDPFVWQHGKMVDINPGNFGGAQGGTNYLDNRGHAVGFGTQPGEASAHPFLWVDGKLTDLNTVGTLGGGINSAYNVNALAHVVGVNSVPGTSDLHAVLWRDGTFTDLATLNGDDCSQPYRINDRDQIVGASFSCETGVEHAILWENGTLLNLNALIPSDSGVALQSANWITDEGEIAAQGVLTSGADAGATRAVLLIPDGECSDAELMASKAVGRTSANAAPAGVQAPVDAHASVDAATLNLKWLRPFSPAGR